MQVHLAFINSGVGLIRSDAFSMVKRRNMRKARDEAFAAGLPIFVRFAFVAPTYWMGAILM